MIEVSVQSPPLVVGQRARLAIRFANVGSGACTDVVFVLELPPGITLMSGRSRIIIAEIPPGNTHVHEVEVLPAREGGVTLRGPNFSYRDQFNGDVRDSFSAPVSVAAAPPKTSARQQPVLGVAAAPGRPIALGEWDDLRIVVHNTADIPVNDIAVAVSGPFQVKGSPVRLAGPLPIGARRTAGVSFLATTGGRRVPVTVLTRFSYPDGRGTPIPAEQWNELRIVVEARRAEPAPPGPATPSPATVTQTILYLAAQPPDLPPLLIDREMREVKERLRSGRYRDRYRLESYVAARVVDIGQALVDDTPFIAHFSGHGAPDGSLYVEGSSGLSEPADPGGLARWFGLYSASIKCVIVNVCHSARLAQAMAEHVDYAIGMRAEVGDEAGITFSVGFYQALASGQEVPDAFEHARGMIATIPATSPEYETPVLYRHRKHTR
jgi:hypothetical protein